ncbi:hypothetical protein FHETE_3391 [Fusarium heterosporum]|uniref:Zn(2)-C6 fungal-type domain-containing protein n=1 Tax=Fusarium heterosporum TaxID=42747 RepID=A0A8H5TRQ1_FUSHE|nr:hypothetical protein FHETE_3391 [Fusarium heterosporum]
MPPSNMKNLTGVFRATGTHKVTRNRKPVSCTTCQKRKSKCDRAKPSCSACQQRGDAAACVYGDTSVFAEKQDMQLKVAKLEEMVMRLAAASEASTNQKSTGLSGDPSNSSIHGVEEGSDAAYHGETSWEAVFKSIHDIQSHLNTQDDVDGLSEPETILPTPDIAIGGISPLTIHHVCSSLPSRRDADIVINTYFNSKFLAVPVLHERHFRRRYELLWANPQNANFLWLSIMFSVLSLGALTCKIRHPGLETVQEPKFYIQRSAQCLVTGEYLKAKPYSVEALMMYAHSRNVSKEDSDATIWSLYSLSVRLAQRRGYHLDAARVSPHIKPFEAEMRRRTWFMVQTSDLLFSYQLGMPPMVYQEVCDAGHPRNLSDDDFDEDTDVPQSRPPTEPTPMLAWQTKSHLCRLLRRVLRHALRVETPSYEETMGLQAELETFHNNIPKCFLVRPIHTTPCEVPGYTIMHRLIIEVSYLKTICVLHRPYLSVEKNQEGYRASRDICRDAASRIVELHLEFEDEVQEGGHLYESTDITPENRIRRAQILERAYKNWELRGSHSKDARHGAKVIRTILDRINMSANSISGIGPPKMLTPACSYSERTVENGILDFGMSDLDYPGEYEEFLPLNSFFGPADGLDWVSFVGEPVFLPTPH